MFQRFFGRAPRPHRATANTLYEQIVAAARQPAFFADLNVPDTPLGRFEMLAVHMILFLRRIRTEQDLKGIAQEITDEFFLDVDHALRELGIGDTGVPKRMKKLARMFYGRAASYGNAVDSDDSAALSQALARNIMPGETGWKGSEPLAAYVLEAAAHIAAIPHDDIAAGTISWPEAKFEALAK